MQTVYMNALQAMEASREGRTFYDPNGDFRLRQDDGAALIVIDNYLPDRGVFPEDSDEAQKCRERRSLWAVMKTNVAEFAARMA